MTETQEITPGSLTASEKTAQYLVFFQTQDHYT